jgi:uncharacterized protein with HEPN domain
MTIERFDDDYLNDIINAIETIENYTKDLIYDEFIQYNMCIQAVLLNIAIIGESAGKISETVQQKYPEVPFHAIVSMRNRLIHGYFDVDNYRVWLVVQDDLPVLKQQIKKIINEL